MAVSIAGLTLRHRGQFRGPLGHAIWAGLWLACSRCGRRETGSTAREGCCWLGVFLHEPPSNQKPHGDVSKRTRSLLRGRKQTHPYPTVVLQRPRDSLEMGRAYAFADTGECHSFHVAASRDGRWLAVDVQDRAATLCETTSRRRLITLGAERAAIWCLDWTPDNRRLALGLADGGLVIWDIDAVRRELTRIGLGWEG